MGVVRGLFRIAIGLFFGLLSATALIPALAAFMTESNTAPGWTFYLVVLLVAVLTVFAPSIRRAFGRGFLVLGAAVFALPLSALLLSGRAMSEAVGTAPAGSEAMAVIGSGLAGAVVTGASAFIGFFLGSIFLIVGSCCRWVADARWSWSTAAATRATIRVSSVLNHSPRMDLRRHSARLCASILVA